MIIVTELLRVVYNTVTTLSDISVLFLNELATLCWVDSQVSQTIAVKNQMVSHDFSRDIPVKLTGPASP